MCEGVKAALTVGCLQCAYLTWLAQQLVAVSAQTLMLPCLRRSLMVVMLQEYRKRAKPALKLVINMSFGTLTYLTALQSMLQQMGARKDVLMFAAAGNDGRQVYIIVRRATVQVLSRQLKKGLQQHLDAGCRR
jgi:hypothetical protein